VNAQQVVMLQQEQPHFFTPGVPGGTVPTGRAVGRPAMGRQAVPPAVIEAELVAVADHPASRDAHELSPVMVQEAVVVQEATVQEATVQEAMVVQEATVQEAAAVVVQETETDEATDAVPVQPTDTTTPPRSVARVVAVRRADEGSAAQ